MTISSSPRVDGQATRGNCGGTAPLSTAAALSYPRRDQYHASQQSPAWSGIDWLSEDKAMRLVAKIRAYWAKRGHSVNVWVEPFKAPESIKRGGWFAIRSDMIGGRPRPSHPMVRP